MKTKSEAEKFAALFDNLFDGREYVETRGGKRPKILGNKKLIAPRTSDVALFVVAVQRFVRLYRAPKAPKDKRRTFVKAK